MRRMLSEATPQDDVSVSADRKFYFIEKSGQGGTCTFKVNKKSGSVECFFPKNKRIPLSRNEMDDFVKPYLRKVKAPKELIDKLYEAR